MVEEKTAMAFFSGKTIRTLLIIGSSCVGIVPVAHAQRTSSGSETLERINRTGYVSCGVTGNVLGFSVKNEQGEWQGFDIDYCRALAAAIFDDPSKIRIKKINASSVKEELAQKRVDVVVARISTGMGRQTKNGLLTPAITYYDGQGLLVAKKLEISSVRELADKTICVQKATVKADSLTEFFRIRKIFIKLVGFSSGQEIFEGYERGECDAVAADMATLYAWRMVSKHAEDFTFLAEIISKEPTGPVILDADPQWRKIIYWTHMAMVNAEELSINQRNVEEEKTVPNLATRHLLGAEGGFGNSINLPNEWAYRIIRHIGNYGDVFERNLGAGTPLKIKRGQNALWSEGGLQYAIPIR